MASMQTLIGRVYRRAGATLRLFLLYFQDRRSYHLLRTVRRTGLTFLGLAARLELYDAVRRIEAQGAPGILIEMGTALGGSALVIAAAKPPARKLLLYDVFGLIPPPSDHDGAIAQQRYAEISRGAATGVGGTPYYGYRTDLLDAVKQSFTDYGFDLVADQIGFVQGLYEETLVVNEPVALAHIDCDWYDSVMTCLQRIAPHLAPGGVLVIDDYYQWPGCKQAVDEYFAGRENEFRFVRRARLHIVRRP